MKFCKKNTHSYIGNNNILTTADYVTDEDVIQHHGLEFFNEWSKYTTNLPKLNVDDKGYVFYEDYKFFAYRVDLYLNSH